MRGPVRAGAAVTAVLFASACVDRFTIPPAQLQYLNGYDIHGEQSVNGVTFTDSPYRLLSTDGQPVDYNSSKELLLLGDAGTPLAPPGPFQTIFITPEAFNAVPVFGPPVAVPLQAVSSVEVVQHSAAKTTLLVTFFLVVATIIPTIIVVSNHGVSTSSDSVGHPPAALK